MSDILIEVLIKCKTCGYSLQFYTSVGNKLVYDCCTVHNVIVTSRFTFVLAAKLGVRLNLGHTLG